MKDEKREGNITTLDMLQVGGEAVIVKVGGEGALRCRLLDMGLIPKTIVKVRKIAPLGDPLELSLRGYVLTIRMEDAKKIEISRLVKANVEDEK